MAILQGNGISIAYDDVGPHPGASTILLLHGFASNRTENWRRVGWLGAFERRRMRAIAIDLRGHGESAKPHDPADYAQDTLVADVIGAMDALGLRSTVLMGYSMGARLAVAVALAHPERVDQLILGGVGGKWFDPSPVGNPIAEAMEALDVDAIISPLAKGFRRFADQQGENRQALAALARSPRISMQRDALAALRPPTLIVAGALDGLAGNPEELAALIPQARAVSLPGCDHFSAIAHVLFKAAVFDFLEDAGQ